jgi:putative aldouronate transport system permease protein
MMFFIITMILSGGLIPSYMLMKELRLLDTFWVYIIPAMGGTFNMLIIKLFVENMPDSIMESADLDGATEMQKMLYIAMPLLVPTIAALSLFAAVGQWNSWFDAMLYIQNAKLHPLSLVVRNLMFSATIQDKSGNLTMYEKATTEGMKMATIVLAAIPILCVYPFLQKYFIYGVYTGSVKG